LPKDHHRDDALPFGDCPSQKGNLEMTGHKPLRQQKGPAS